MATRTAITVLREIQMVKSVVTDEALRAQLLAPLNAELAAMAKFQAAQGSLSLPAAEERATKK